MPGATPEQTFAEARAAMERGDWDGLFACLDPADLAKATMNTVNRFLMAGGAAGDAFLQICAQHGPGEATVRDLKTKLARISESARTMTAGRDPATMVAESRRHQEVVKAYQQALDDALKSVADVAHFTAALERAIRADGSGGSVSSNLFVGETLEGVSIDGSKAWATRRMSAGATEEVGFSRRKGAWYIRLTARRR
jgi:hypothetical protein